MTHAVMVLGVMLVAATALSVVMRTIRQSMIIAFVLVGIAAGAFRSRVQIDPELLDVFTELGIILLLYMAGIEMDFESLRKRWRTVLSYGVGQIVLNTLAGAVLGYAALGLTGTSTLLYFGLCLTFSSTIVVMSFLRSKRELESFHGQIILGLMVLQDVAAVVSLVILTGIAAGGGVGASIGLIALKLVGLGVLLYAAARLVLEPVFRYYAHAKDLLFIGSMSWAMGVAAFCEFIDFSPEIGAFMAGAAISFLPYRLEIQDKVEPMKDFGIVLFFVTLGYKLDIGPEALALVAPTLLTAAFVLLSTPVLIIIIGYLTRTKSRPTFYIGFTINQISEFSLILTTLCVQAGVFPRSQLLLMTLATLVTIFLSSYGQQFLETLYAAFSGTLRFLDRRSVDRYATAHLGGALEGHVVVIQYNELAETVVEHFLAAGKTVVVLDLDPDVYAHLTGSHPRLACMYLDAFDPDTREEAYLADAHVIVSCMIQGQEAEIGILTWLRESGLQVPFIAATDSRTEALALYRAGATFVVQTEDMAASQLEAILDEHGEAPADLRARGLAHQEELRRLKTEGRFQFA